MVEFFTAEIRNPHTRRAYGSAVGRFLAWCEVRGLTLETLYPFLIASYIEELAATLAVASVKQHLAALRMLFDYLVVGQVLPHNPADAVRGPKLVVRVGKTPVFQDEEPRTLFAAIAGDDLLDRRDKALLAVLLYSFARVGAGRPGSPATSSTAAPWSAPRPSPATPRPAPPSSMTAGASSSSRTRSRE